LLLFRENPHSRESLANLLWSDVPTTKSKSYLRKTLWQLQTALDSEDLLGEPNVLLVDPEWVQINTTSAFWLDVAEIERAFHLVHGVPGEKLDFEAFEKLQRTVDFYRGDLLEGWYQEWCLRERERLQSIFLILLDKLMSYCEAKGNYEDGLVYGMRILQFDQARERTHRSLMRLYYQGGYRTEALRQYQRCVEILDMELGVQPSKQTTTLYEQIRSDGFFATTAGFSMNMGKTGANEPPLGDVLTSLISLQKDLNSIQAQIQQKIETVEKLLTH
jgi:DNA-binding SARP family transcriptional activator